MPLLAKELGSRYAEMLENRAEGRRLCEIEREAFGWTHADAGAAMARAWRLPDSFAEMIQGHAELDQWLRSRNASPGMMAVALSAHLPSASEDAWTECGTFTDAYNRLAKPGSAPAVEMLRQIDVEFNEFAPVLKVAKPARTLVELFADAKQPVSA